jgi:hypothetical protein
MARRTPQADLFAAIDHASEPAVDGEAQARRPHGKADARGDSLPQSVSIEWFARKQAEYYEAGKASATAYWKAKGIVRP